MWRRIVPPTVATVLGISPAVLLGVAAPLAEGSGGPGLRQLDVGIAVFFGCSALAAMRGGRLADRTDALVLTYASSAVSCLGLLCIAVLGDRATVLYITLAVSGLANAVSQSAGDVVLAHHCPRSMRDVAFGIKLAAIPLSSLLAGGLGGYLAPDGWRPLFALPASVYLLHVVAVPGRRGDRRRTRRDPAASTADRRGPTTWLVRMAVAAGLGSAAGTALQVYFVSSMTRRSFAVAPASVLLAVASALCIAARILWPWVGSRWPDVRRPLLSVLFAGGSGCLAVLGFAADWMVVAVVTIGAFVTGWAWAGLLAAFVIDRHPEAPGLASGTVMTAVWVGAFLGPGSYAVLRTTGSDARAWLVMASFLALAAMLVIWPTARPAVAGDPSTPPRQGLR